MSDTLGSLRELVDRVTSDAYASAEDTTGDEDTMHHLVDEHGEDVMQAAITFLDVSRRSIGLDSLEELLSNGAYRGEWRTFGEFVREEDLVYIEEGGREAVKVYKKYRDFVDWDEYASTPEWSDYIPIRRYPEDDSRTTVYVFRDL